ncbi:MAG: hypothetical protein M1113_05725 [Candidatus Thermoplasmatota archaeon]|jgi:hypothetical protein|nr:hypothetical protein [Candidatus Thermoplasmatota archaeon]
MRFIRATDRQIQAIKNLCFNRSNLYYVYETLEELGKESLSQLSVGDADDLISALLPKGDANKSHKIR